MGTKRSARTSPIPYLLALASLFPAFPQVFAAPRILLHRTRASPSDLEVGGDLINLPAGQTRFVHYADLAQLPQRRFIAVGDANFGRPVHLSGIPLDQLPMLFGAPPNARMVTALAADRYKANYPPAYLQAHHPVLILTIEGQPSPKWSPSRDRPPMGPYLISHAAFTPSFRVLAHQDEPQIPWAVIRIDIRRESAVYAPIQPSGPHAADPSIQQGYLIAGQNCFRCHNELAEGGTKAQRSWNVVARRCVADPEYFNTYVRTPTKLNPASQMAASPQYDAATLAALRAYFRVFAIPSND